MSRSKKKSPFIPITTARSEKDDKSLANKRNRRINKVILNTTHNQDLLEAKKVTSDIWEFSKDGKRRVDVNEFEKELRK